MMFFVLYPKYTPDGEPLFRPVDVAKQDLEAMTEWRFVHQKGRQAARDTFGEKTFQWNGSDTLAIADFPPSDEPGGVFSKSAINALESFLTPNGDIYQLKFRRDEANYFLFDCWSEVDAKTNDDFNLLSIRTLKSLTVDNAKLSDIFMVNKVAAPIVSQAFKIASNQAGLTGMEFIPIEIIGHIEH